MTCGNSSPWRVFFLALVAAAWLEPAAVGQDLARSGLAAFEGIAVETADRTEVSRLTDAGVVSLGNAGGMVVTLAGELGSRADHDGVIGVLFLPEIGFFNSVYRSKRVLLAAAEYAAPVRAGDSTYFLANPKHFPAGFPQYRVLLFNTTGATVSANVYIHPTRD
jgi:hypothetical protein